MKAIEGARTTRGLLQEGAAVLRAAGIGPALREAEWLLSRLTGIPALELYLVDGLIDAPVCRAFQEHVAARAAGRPLQYLLGEAEFFGRPFSVEPGVFIPRPETERLAGELLPRLRSLQGRRGGPLRVVEPGTGSGCLAVTLACELPTCQIAAIELSWCACLCALRNVRRHGAGGRVQVIQASWAGAVRGGVDAVVSNPPYVPSVQLDTLPLDVQQEPRISLDGGADGLDAIRVLSEQAPKLLKPAGLFAVECGEEQAGSLASRLGAADWVASAETFNDLTGRPRGVIAVRRS